MGFLKIGTEIETNKGAYKVTQIIVELAHNGNNVTFELTSLDDSEIIHKLDSAYIANKLDSGQFAIII